MRMPLSFQTRRCRSIALAGVMALVMAGLGACGRSAPEASSGAAETSPWATTEPVESNAVDRPDAGPTSRPEAGTGAGEPGVERAGTPSRSAIGAPLVPMDEASIAARYQRARERSLAAAKAGGPDRYLTHLGTVPPYDRAAFIADPDGYLSEAVPGRALRDAGPKPDAPELVIEGPGLRRAVVGQPVTINVRARPGAPVSFYSSDLALADNGLAAISVQAGRDGRATARYTAQPGAVDDAHIWIASPECTGVLRVTLNVSRPVPSEGKAP